MLRRTIFALLALLPVLFLASCRARVETDPNLVVVTVYPYELLVRQLTGDSLSVQTLIPANASPHDWSPRPSDLVALESAALVISNGLGLESGFESKLNTLKRKHLRVSDLLTFDASTHSDKENHGSEMERGSEAGHGHETNPHLWLSAQYMSELVPPLAAELKARFPRLTETIDRNMIRLLVDLVNLNTQIILERNNLGEVGLVSYHDSFHYFLDEYDINYVGSVQTSPGKEPTQRELKELGDRIRSARVTCISVEPQMDRRSAEVLAREFGLTIVELDPLGTSLNPNSFPDLLRVNWERLRQGWSQKKETQTGK